MAQICEREGCSGSEIDPICLKHHNLRLCGDCFGELLSVIGDFVAGTTHSLNAPAEKEMYIPVRGIPDEKRLKQRPSCRKCSKEMSFQGGYNQGKERLDVIYTHEVYTCPSCRTRKVIRR